MGIIFQRPIKLTTPSIPPLPPIPKPTRWEGESEKSHRKRVLEWMIDKEIKS